MNNLHSSLLFTDALHNLTVNKSTHLVLESHKNGQEFLMFAADPQLGQKLDGVPSDVRQLNYKEFHCFFFLFIVGTQECPLAFQLSQEHC